MQSQQKQPMRVDRVARFRQLRDNILPYLGCDQLIDPTSGKMWIGSFFIRYSIQRRPDEVWHNIQIWPPGGDEFGTYVYGNKVANVNWDGSDNVDIITFRPGPWQEQLLALLPVGAGMTVEVYGNSPKTGQRLRASSFS